MAFSPDSPANSKNSAGPESKPVGDALPPVQAPTAGFLLQLFLIPMVIVSIIVMIWLMFSWLVHMGSDPKDIVRDLGSLNESSWQKAYTLSNMLRNPEYDLLKDDSALASEVASVLASELKAADVDEQRIMLRVFLAKTLGEFRVTDGLPVLLEAAATERDSAERDVRLAAIESLAVLAQNAGTEKLRDNAELMNVLMDASREQRPGVKGAPSDAEVRSTAAFALGVLGGDEALNQLDLMLDDGSPNVRFNAATGLARHGDLRAERGLIEMLDPTNEQALEGELSDSEKGFKRGLVLTNGLNASAQLARQNRDQDLAELQLAIENLVSADVPRAIQIRATEALETFHR